MSGFRHESPVSATVVWLTPPALLADLGPFDLDPCAAEGQPWATAAHHYTATEDGLIQPWSGFVWCNPPFGPGIDAWLDRMAEHRNGIALVPARTETRWFRRSVWERADAVLFLHGRVRFHHLDGSAAAGAIGTPICLVAYGKEATERLRRAATPGVFVSTWSQPSERRAA